MFGRAGVAFRVENRVGPHHSKLSGLYPAAHLPAVYASRTRSPAPMQDSLPPGDLRPWAVGNFTRGLLSEVSDRYLLFLFGQAYPGALSTSPPSLVTPAARALRPAHRHYYYY